MSKDNKNIPSPNSYMDEDLEHFISSAGLASPELAEKESKVFMLGYYDENDCFKLYDIYSTTPEMLSKHGVVLQLYFLFIKKLS